MILATGIWASFGELTDANGLILWSLLASNWETEGSEQLVKSLNSRPPPTTFYFDIPEQVSNPFKFLSVERDEKVLCYTLSPFSFEAFMTLFCFW